ncbi:XdhC family protein [Heyndrickxia ginsengihumi]|uniref:XdhC family protein n=1 Tax=Heyndrickxia ginsengihumi TaxID=363870 RepID=UPI003D1949F9
MEDMYEILDEIYFNKLKGVLATVIHVEGSAYKKEGAAMFFKDDGTQVGLISAGCLEEDLAARIQNGFGQQTETIVYDMRGYNDLSWGEGSGCNGIIEVLVEPVDATYYEHLLKLKALLEKGIAVTFMKCLSTGSYLFLTEDGHYKFGSLRGESINIQECFRLRNGKNYLSMFKEEVYIHHYYPKPRLIIFGAGKDTIPLVSLAAQTGFTVTVSDWRPGLCNKRNFPNADVLVVGFPSTELIEERIKVSPHDFVLIVTHHFSKDAQLLAYLLDKNIRYLGVLGSSRRTKRLLGMEQLPSNIRTPIGLSIAAEGPEEIAVSIVAELIQLKNQLMREEVHL